VAVIEHEPWRGLSYEKGIDSNSQRIAVVGYSHHGNEEDTNKFTNNVVCKAIAGKCKLAFFNQIAGYFGSGNIAVFWNWVLFFNYLPDLIGADDDRYKSGSEDQIERANGRFLRLLQEYVPQKVLVFSTKAWQSMPPTREEEAGRDPCASGRSYLVFHGGLTKLALITTS
jgi:hypothetical protein